MLGGFRHQVLFKTITGSHGANERMAEEFDRPFMTYNVLCAGPSRSCFCSERFCSASLWLTSATYDIFSIAYAAGAVKRPKPEPDTESGAGADVALADGSAEQPAKLIKLEDGTAAPIAAAQVDSATASAPPSRSGTPGLEHRHRGGPSSDEFVLTADMENILVNFLVRMAFLIGESQDKDPDMQALHQHTLKLLSQALSLFPHIPVKLSAFLERLLQVRKQQ